MTSAQPLLDAFTKWDKPEARFDFAVRRHRRTRSRLVHRAVLRLFYLQTILKVNAKQASIIVAIALLFGMPFFTVFGALPTRSAARKS